MCAAAVVHKTDVVMRVIGTQAATEVTTMCNRLSVAVGWADHDTVWTRVAVDVTEVAVVVAERATALLGMAVAKETAVEVDQDLTTACLLYTSPSPRDQRGSRMPSSA